MELDCSTLEFKGPADRTRHWTGLNNGRPSTKQEEWKYVPVDVLMDALYPTVSPSSDSFAPRPEPLNVQTGIQFLSLEQALEAEIPGIQNAKESIQNAALDGLAHAYRPVNQSGIRVLYVPSNLHCIDPIAAMPAVAQSTSKAEALLVLLGENAHLTLFLPHEAQSNRFSFLYVGLDKGAKLELNRDLAAAPGTLFMSHIQGSVAESAELKLVQWMQGGEAQRHSVQVSLNGQQAIARISSLQVAEPQNQLHSWVNMIHASPEAESHQNIRQLSKKEGTSSFTGKIHVALDAQKTQAYQHSAAMVLEEGGRTYHRPVLEIYADDVKCSHGATTGSLDEQALFYLQCRGISKASAKRLLIEAFIEGCIQDFYPALQSHFRTAISKSIQQL